jgi:hypothetical protein
MRLYAAGADLGAFLPALAESGHHHDRNRVPLAPPRIGPARLRGSTLVRGD